MRPLQEPFHHLEALATCIVERKASQINVHGAGRDVSKKCNEMPTFFKKCQNCNSFFLSRLIEFTPTESLPAAAFML